ncbi:MAG: TetR/AcrR family transcriptional regulator [Candidatus Bipolaricaulaceae bacterium]
MADTPSLEDRIMDAAARLFAGQGFHAAGMRAVARAAGVSIGAIYHYFSSKEEVYFAILRRELERRRAAVETLRARDPSAEQAIRHVVRLHFDLLREGGESVRLMSRAWLPASAALRERAQALYQEFAAYVADLLAEGMAAGKLRRCPPLVTAYALLGMAEAVTARCLAGDETARMLMEQAPTELAEMAWRALRPENGG